MKIFSDTLLYSSYAQIKNKLPIFVISAINKLIPFFLLASIFEILGLAVIIPAVDILIYPKKIETNSVLNYLHSLLDFESHVSFSLFLFILIGIIFIIKNAILYLIIKYQTKTGFNMAVELAAFKYKSLLSKPYGFFSENNSSVLLRNITYFPIDMVIYHIFPIIGLLNEFFVLIIIVLAIAWFNPLLFFATIIFALPFFFMYDRIFKKRLKYISHSRDTESGKMYKAGMQSLEGFREITVFNKRDYFTPIYQKSIQAYSKAVSTEYSLNLFSPKIVETIAILCLVNIFLFGYLFGKNMDLLIQFMAVFAIASYRIVPSINKIILYSNYIKSSAHLPHYFYTDSNEEQKEPTPSDASQPKPLRFSDSIEIRDLSFKFKPEEKNILSSLNLSIKKGEIVGITGPSGSGKSTLLNILLWLFKEYNGGIFVDGEKISDANLKAWYALVSYVPQQMTILDGTIKENIAFGIEKNIINESLLANVIERAQLKEYITSLPDGINTHVGEKGIKISGGQRQRIAIARALYHGGSILIFDEATSALDSETEEMLTEAIHNIAQQELTIIIVSHTLKTLRYCNWIYPLEKGSLGKPKKYEELLKT